MEEQKLINKFMGITEQTYPLLTHLSDLNYKRWDNLMPVVEKILAETYEDTGENIFLRTFGMKNDEGEFMVRFNREFLHTHKDLNEATYQACLEHIKTTLSLSTC